MFNYKLKNSGFTLIELVIVIAIAAILSTVIYMAVLPAQRIGKANNAVRVQDTKAIEKAIKAVLLDSVILPTAITDIAEDTYYSLVASGASPSGQYTCDQLDADINRLDIASTLEPYIGTLPIDPEINSGDDSGYYLIRTKNLFDVGSCAWYTAPVVTTCGDGVIEGDEVCDDGNTDLEYCGDGDTTVGGCNADCSASLGLNEACDDGGVVESCGDGELQSGSFCNSACSGYDILTEGCDYETWTNDCQTFLSDGQGGWLYATENDTGKEFCLENCELYSDLCGAA